MIEKFKVLDDLAVRGRGVNLKMSEMLDGNFMWWCIGIGATGRGMEFRKEVMLECDVCIGQQDGCFREKVLYSGRYQSLENKTKCENGDLRRVAGEIFLTQCKTLK